MATSSDRDVEDAISKLLQMGTVVEYESKFVVLANRVIGISANLLKSFYISGLKPALQCALLRLNPKTLDEAFSLARAMEASFTNLQLLEFLKSNPSTLGEAFFKARITEACFEDERSITDISKTNDLKTGVQQQENKDNLNEISKEKDSAKPPISTNTFSSNGGNDSRTSGFETPTEELVDNGIEREVVVGLLEEFQEGDMVDALSRVK
ncbi:hypothetical protein Tco_0598211 [Tanacetum coccineum]